MHQPYVMRLPKDFPARLFHAAKDLQPLGINEMAWLYPDVVEVISELAKHGDAIVGGDVFRTTERGLQLTYDKWYVDQNKGWPWTEYVAKAAETAISYIETYHSRNEGEFWYSLVFVHDLERPVNA